MKTLQTTFISPEEIFEKLKTNTNPSKQKIREIISKALSIQTLLPEEVACLINLKDEELWQEIFDAALKLKRKFMIIESLLLHHYIVAIFVRMIVYIVDLEGQIIWLKEKS